MTENDEQGSRPNAPRALRARPSPSIALFFRAVAPCLLLSALLACLLACLAQDWGGLAGL
ncbi:uncharacterized protein K452DRAFT_292824 [Aplosporella prunicola CBS 121167]|uniref:Uncharacterized protein n=1 Tax=Aplosporella prunicola CBS 121167 TaxID=1176127 RepID=A0A6A6AY70_9PEZI|nr:uncharacterized protein K452DRAFT_292824 [Aplosporella prunicola CBS 121167]KAF2135925.1 hypothetical protein K452DRAFT_292824 [Aplosporella prunicola CBS 121167]